MASVGIRSAVAAEAAFVTTAIFHPISCASSQNFDASANASSGQMMRSWLIRAVKPMRCSFANSVSAVSAGSAAAS